MAYSFQPEDAGLQAALRRIAAEELGSALAKLRGDGAPSATAVHDVRKHVKKLRGLLRLLRPGFPDYQVENAALRDAAANLSAMRDAEVRLATFDRVTARDRPEHLAPLRALLAADRGAAGDPSKVVLARDTLAALHDRAAGWRIKGKDADLLAEGLTATRRGARAAMLAARATPDELHMHEWRKRVKDGWYQARLLAPIWPAVMAPLADQAGLLAEDLGDHHDLDVLAAHITVLPGDSLTDDARADALSRLAEARRAMEARIFPLGATLLSGKPRDVARLWVGWWQVWRG